MNTCCTIRICAVRGSQAEKGPFQLGQEKPRNVREREGNLLWSGENLSHLPLSIANDRFLSFT